MQQGLGRNLTENSTEVVDPGTHQLTKRRNTPRACVLCRNTKTRCVLVEGLDSCEACFKKSRECAMPGPTKPRFKPSQKISELEKKIEILTNALSTTTHQIQSEGDDDSDITMPSTSHHMMTERSEPSQRVKLKIFRATESRDRSAQSYADVVDQGLINMATAEVLFNHWNLSMRPIFPTMSPTENNMKQVRNTKPMLFLAILNVASASILPSFQPRLVTELNEQLAEHILIRGRRSIDLIQASLLYSQYYLRAPASQHSTSTQFASAAITMLCDLCVIERLRRESNPSNERSKEAARTWLTGWYTASSNATLLQQQIPMLPSLDLEASISILLSVACVPRSDLQLCSLVRLQMVLEDISNILRPGGREILEAFDTPVVQYKLKMLQQRLEDWKISAHSFVDDRLKKCATEFANLCIHHIALRNYNRRIFASQDQGNLHTKGVTLSVRQFDSLCHCLKSSQAVIDTYLSLEDPLARSLPNNYLMWTLYAAVALIKLTPFREEIWPGDITTNSTGVSAMHHLDAMIGKISKITENGCLPQAKSWSAAFIKLKLWYSHKKHVCLNAHGDCEANATAPIYSVFDDGPEPSLASPKATPKSTSTPPLDSRQPSNIIHSEERWQAQPIEQQVSPPTFGFNSDTMQTSSRHDTGAAQVADRVPSMEAARETFAYTNTDWDDWDIDADDLQELDTLMMEDSDSWLNSLI